MGIPHCTAEADTLDSCHIPKGAIVMPNIWLFAHDREVYTDPMAFKPERLLAEPPAPDPKDFVFGFGRRQCPEMGSRGLERVAYGCEELGKPGDHQEGGS